jgi:hypothetical protein
MFRSRLSTHSPEGEFISRQNRDNVESSLEDMQKDSQQGSVLITVILSVLLVFSLVFGFWAFGQMHTYKDKSDQKVAAAVSDAVVAQQAADQKKFDDESKNPYRTFTSSQTYGSITFNYPKTWSAYVDTSNSSSPINGYFHPDQLPAIDDNFAFALHVELLNTPYNQAVHVAYVPDKLQKTPNVQAGVRLNGNFGGNGATKNGSMVIIQVRDKTLKISTEAPNYLNDFNNIILKSLAFSP